MTERPILFSGPMVRAILSGAKTQTRRVINPQPEPRPGGAWHVETRPISGYNRESTMRDFLPHYCPYGQPGNTLYVRETFSYTAVGNAVANQVMYRADGEQEGRAPVWRPSIHMPRWASRITLEVAAVRVERVQDISEADARAEGTPIGEWFKDDLDGGRLVKGDHRLGFRALWDTINGKRPGCAWADNPYVWVIDFRRLP